jgi:hypothetical protein
MIFLGEFPVLGPKTLVQEVSGYAGSNYPAAGQPSLQAFKPTTREPVQAALTATSTSGYMFQAPWQCQVIGIHYNCTTVGGASNLSVERIIGDTVAPGAANGTTIILLTSAVLAVAGATANTRQNLALSTAAGSPLILNAGDQIAYFLSAAPTGLVGGLIQVEIAQLG